MSKDMDSSDRFTLWFIGLVIGGILIAIGTIAAMAPMAPQNCIDLCKDSGGVGTFTGRECVCRMTAKPAEAAPKEQP